MPSLPLLPDEDLFLKVRPHPISFLARHAAALLWLVAGALGAAVARTPIGGGWVAPLAVLTVGAAGLFGALVWSRIRNGSGVRYAWFGFIVALGVAAALAPAWPTPFSGAPALWYPAGLGLLLASIRLVGLELYRRQRVHFVTSERVVARAGLGHRKEESVTIKQIREVRGRQGPLGQVFGYGDVTLVLGVSRGQEDTRVLHGVRRVADVKHRIEQLLEESRMPTRDRRRRVDDRRLKDSMRLLSAWMGRDRTNLRG